MLKSVLLAFILMIGIQEKKLTEIQNLKADNFLLKAQLSQCNTKLNEIGLVAEQEKLIEEFRKQFGVSSDMEWDWATKSFKEKK